ncbi:hypothetical protein HHK36_005498 [Tetracentron sinense]|uniref:non-specific serine/threonine protein kinase n=1 Tax=Tetracentron sinense TaxID=13715 RepID=A0A834ZNE8_TETSI|nr:hypothetical protein HHK36_005498 [Tetracentron sinense]
MEDLPFLFFWYTLISISFFTEISIAADTITPTQFITISDGQTLVSSAQTFELGFFSPGNSKNSYIGIWYKNSPSAVLWVANRENPITDSSGVLTIGKDGNLVLLNQAQISIWSSNLSKVAENSVAQLLESGYLVLRDKSGSSSKSYQWQSFDYPSDTQFPGMKMGWNLKTGLNRYLTSWKNADDPSPGHFSYRIDNLGLPQLVLREGSSKLFRSGPWNGLRFSGVRVPFSANSTFNTFLFVYNTEELYYTYEHKNSIITRFTLNQSSLLRRLIWNEGSSEWTVIYTLQNDLCDSYGRCGANGICKMNDSLMCKCLVGFIPKSPLEWDVLNSSSVCMRRVPLDCEKGEGFIKIGGVKLPDLLQFWLNKNMSLKECKVECLKNCSCTAYANSDIRGGGSCCLLWFGDLIDIREFSEGDSIQDIYIRMAASEPGKALELVGAAMEDSYVASQVMKCIQVGLLCVQKYPEDRPIMSSVVAMLSNESVTLPQPKQPGFFTERNSTDTDLLPSKEKGGTENTITITMLEEISIAADTITPTQSISDSQTLVSSAQTFELGFFSPGNSKNSYIGIWYKNSPSAVLWVANRENPITDSSGVLTIGKDGNLVLQNHSQIIIWSSNLSEVAENSVAQLMESGNLVLQDKSGNSSERYLWQSFDYPSDTQFPGMKMGWNLKTGLNRYLTSWKNADDPSPGDFSYRIDNLGLPQLVLREGSSKLFRSGPWNGLRFSGVPFSANSVFNSFFFVYNTEELYYMYEHKDNSFITRFTLNQSSLLQRLIWNEGSFEWTVMYTLQNDQCDSYGRCGANGICKMNDSPMCKCLVGFIPKSSKEWGVLNSSSGCVRRVPLDCEKGEGFIKIGGVKLPDLLQFWLNKNMSLKECKVECLKNCSCTAYADSDIREGGSGCLLWFGDLIDIREFSEGDNIQDIYIRMAASEPGMNVFAIYNWSGKEEGRSRAWLQWKEGKALELVDAAMEDSYVVSQVMKCIQVGLLCVQKYPEDRPIMSSVVVMLSNESVTLPQPKQPGFFTERNSTDTDLLSSKEKGCTENTVTITVLEEISIAADTITATQSINDGQTLVSSDQTFELGFFSAGNSKNRYIGIWYKNSPPAVLWVANRENPITDSSGVLTIGKDGNLVLLNRSQIIIWSSDLSEIAENSVAQLLESGNLVLQDDSGSSSKSYLWQSFDYPSDTQFPGMKMGWNLKTGLNRYLTSWKNVHDPSPGDFSYRIDNLGLPQLVLREGSSKLFRTGPWNGLRFSGVPFSPNTVFNHVFVYNTEELYYMYEDNKNSFVTRFTLNQSSLLQRLIWNKESFEWTVIYTLQNDLCDSYGRCGATGICQMNDPPMCKCLVGFIPKSSKEWGVLNSSSGCVRRIPLDCQKGEGFIKIGGVKLPDLLQFWLNKNMSLDECKVECLKKCSCTAYANSDIRGGGSGCLLWFGDLIDIREFSEGNSIQDIYIRLAASEPEEETSGGDTCRININSFGDAYLWRDHLVPYLEEEDSGKRSGKEEGRSRAWLLWIEGKALELVDAMMENSYVVSQVMRCIQVGLLCVQKYPEDRPIMSSVVVMLSNESVTMPQPKQPGFFTERSSTDTGLLSSNEKGRTENPVTITVLEGR